MPTMVRSRALVKHRQRKPEVKETVQNKQQGLRDKHWNIQVYLMTGKKKKIPRRRDPNITREESSTLAALNSSLKPGAAKSHKHTSETEEPDKGSKDAKQQENEKRLNLSDQTINEMISISELMYEVKESFHEKIKEINDQEDALLELEYATRNLERLCSRSQLIWKIDDFSHKYAEAVSGRNSTLYSPPFETHKYGYKIALSFCPFGDGRAKGKYASLFFCILKTDYDALLPWPFANKLSFAVLDQRETPVHTKASEVVREDYVMEFTPNAVAENEAFIGRPTGFRNSSLGLPRFISIDNLRDEKYVVDDTLYIRVQIHLDNIPKL